MLEKKSWPLGGIFELPTWFIIGGSKGVALISFILNIKKILTTLVSKMDYSLEFELLGK
jgi:hypothetical protein